MTDLNSVNIAGRITKDSTLEKTKSNVSMLKISMVINRSVKKADSNEFENKPIFVDLSPIYGKYAETMEKYMKKGNYITVEGFLDMDSWTNSEGKKRQQLKVVPKIGGINPWILPKKDGTEQVPAEAEAYPEPEEIDIPTGFGDEEVIQ